MISPFIPFAFVFLATLGYFCFNIVYFDFSLKSPFRVPPKYSNSKIQNQIDKNGKLKKSLQMLDPLTGKLNEEVIGYYKQKQFLPIYNSENTQILFPHLRLKEWEYYHFHDEKTWGISFTIGSLGYLGSIGVHLLHFPSKSYKNYGIFELFPSLQLKKDPFPKLEDITDKVCFRKNHNVEDFQENGKKKIKQIQSYLCVSAKRNNGMIEREIEFKFPNFEFKTEGKNEKTFQGLYGKLKFKTEIKKNNSIILITPFKESKSFFYYNYKVNYFENLKGSFYFDKIIQNEESNDKIQKTVSFSSFEGNLDWGRGIWPYYNIWYWGNLNGFNKQNERIGFNIGYGFGDLTKSSENIFYYKKNSIKFGHLKITIPKKPKNNKGSKFITEENWTIKSIINNNTLTDEPYFEAKFEPIIDRFDKTNIISLVYQSAHQVFGYYTGKFIFKDEIDGKKKEIKFEKMIGFCEEVLSGW